MDTAGLAAALVALGGILSTALTWLMARRRYSGRVAMTDAEELWDRLIGELAQRDSRIRGLEESLGEMAATLRVREREVARLEGKIQVLELQLAEKDQRIAHLEQELAARLAAARSALEGAP